MSSSREMDDAARLARRELQRNWEKWSTHALAVWWKKWYTRAGHNRLGRMLIEIAGDRPPADPSEGSRQWASTDAASVIGTVRSSLPGIRGHLG